MILAITLIKIPWGHPLREGVDWNLLYSLPSSVAICHPLREGVDWNLGKQWLGQKDMGHPLREGVDWNPVSANVTNPTTKSPSAWGCGLKWYSCTRFPGCTFVTLCVRVWIEIFYTELLCFYIKVTLCVRVWIEIQITLCNLPIRFGHPLREGVDWNRRELESLIEEMQVTLCVRVWIEILHHL